VRPGAQNAVTVPYFLNYRDPEGSPDLSETE